jgi:uncharacterized MAPEG superfamily protein
LNIEIRILAWTVMLGFVHVVAASHAASLQRGYLWTASARDREAAPLTGIAGRLDRALRNFSETFPLFAALLLAAQAIGRHSWLTEAGAIPLLCCPARLPPALRFWRAPRPVAGLERRGPGHGAVARGPLLGIGSEHARCFGR